MAPSRQGVRKLVAGLSWKASFWWYSFLVEDAQKEHDAFAQALRDEGIEVLYLEQLAAESYLSRNPRSIYCEILRRSQHPWSSNQGCAIRELLHDLKDNRIGWKNNGWDSKSWIARNSPDEAKDLTLCWESDSICNWDPMPNLYFMRPICTTIGNAVA